MGQDTSKANRAGEPMRYEWLLDETADEPPCGPDLELTDPEYFTYLLTAESLLPDSFFRFERASLDLQAESGRIEGYLKQCRDLRLLCLEAKFRILFGQAAAFFECILAMDALLKAPWDSVYPRGEDGDFMLRSGAVATLDDIKTAILPLEYAPLATDRRHGALTARALRVARDEVPAREGETKLDAEVIIEALGAEDHRADVERLHALATGAHAALTSIRSAFAEKAGYEQTPDFDGLQTAIKGIAGMLAEARPDLAKSGAPESMAGTGEGEDAEDAAGGEAPATGGDHGAETTFVSQTITVAGVEIETKNHAKAALLAAAIYFANSEPSNPALILVHQAHSLVGKSFVDAMQILVPGAVEGAKLTVLVDKELQLSIEQMRTLSAEAQQLTQLTDATEDIGNQDQNAFCAKIRPEAVAMLRGVEQFYRANEPSSPIPMLLVKARNYLNLDFEVILADMLPKKESE